jgi:hypothetical protein
MRGAETELSSLVDPVRLRVAKCLSTSETGGILKYMLLLYGPQDAGPAPGTPEFGQMLEEYMAATEAMRAAGVLLDSSPLQPATTATTVMVRGGETQVSDGPFAEIKEMLGGYYLIDCGDLDGAVRWAAMIPAAQYGSIEIRPLMQMGPQR